MANIIILAILVSIISLSITLYLILRKRGINCVGCPGGCCKNDCEEKMETDTNMNCSKCKHKA